MFASVVKYNFYFEDEGCKLGGRVEIRRRLLVHHCDWLKAATTSKLQELLSSEQGCAGRSVNANSSDTTVTEKH